MKDNKDKRSLKVVKSVQNSQHFKALFERIKQKAVYSIALDGAAAVAKAKALISERFKTNKGRIISKKAWLDVDQEGVRAKDLNQKELAAFKRLLNPPDLISILAAKSDFTRDDLIEIVDETKEEFLVNPAAYIACVQGCLEDAVKYTLKSGGVSFAPGGSYPKELFLSPHAQVSDDALECKAGKNLYNYALCDSLGEEEFVKACENSADVKCYLKLPTDFTLDLPSCIHYNPDFALFLQSGEARFYVVEKKTDLKDEQLRPAESLKIQWATAYYEALEGIEYKPLTKFEDL